ncbi:hypothetical protein [Accumulibacter sp.]|uniref:hypothetical protein n=1 Tax=Accumulibacter sp. TaxID=2053492 RepID=UPI0025E77785|nr:hypothetical protein [Accumulibacter sp.]MCM8595745.1 hypothetical protein [Accumulibacter sp.]MCM8626594.1 hypothetical protein [Accumulibacter sp.]MDS4049893.1 hypothetical protein [Accumulibacter sp.]
MAGAPPLPERPPELPKTRFYRVVEHRQHKPDPATDVGPAPPAWLAGARVLANDSRPDSVRHAEVLACCHLAAEAVPCELAERAQRARLAGVRGEDLAYSLRDAGEVAPRSECVLRQRGDELRLEAAATGDAPALVAGSPLAELTLVDQAIEVSVVAAAGRADSASRRRLRCTASISS